MEQGKVTADFISFLLGLVLGLTFSTLGFGVSRARGSRPKLRESGCCATEVI